MIWPELREAAFDDDVVGIAIGFIEEQIVTGYLLRGAFQVGKVLSLAKLFSSVPTAELRKTLGRKAASKGCSSPIGAGSRQRWL